MLKAESDNLTQEQMDAIFLRLNSQDEKIRLDEAFAVFNINRQERDEFEKLQTKQLKKQFLKSTLIQYEFQFWNNKFYWEFGQKAFEIIYYSSLIQAHQDQYGPNSHGITWLDIPFVLDVGKDERTVKPSRYSFSTTKRKDSGVEPGCVGVEYEDIFSTFFEKYPNEKDRLKRIQLIEADAKFFISGNQTLTQSEVLKLTYNNILSLGGIVIPDKYDLSRSSRMKKILKKYGPIIQFIALTIYQSCKIKKVEQLNGEAVSEVLANDVARAFGMEVQDQHLIKNQHSSGHVNFLLKAKWINNANLLQPLAGSTENKNNYVRPVLAEDSGIQYLSSKHIKNLPEHFALFACLGDRDKIGARGQNLLEKNGVLIGIDFGHAYSKKNPLVKTLQQDFTFNAPTFKNYSIFLDAPRSELMGGVMKLARWKGEPLHQAVINSYGTEFAASLNAIEKEADLCVFDDYIRAFTELKQKERKNRATYEAMIKEVRAKKDMHIKSRDTIIKKFKHLLNLPADLIDTMEHFEKMWAASQGHTSMRSPDQTVMLQHLRMTENSVKGWKVRTCDNETVSILANFKSQKARAQAITTLKEHKLNKELSFKSLRGNKLLLRFSRQQLTHIADLMCEENIKAYYHPNDHKLAEKLKREQVFAEHLNILKKYGLNIETSKGEGRNIQLSIHTRNALPAQKKKNWVTRSTQEQEVANFVAKGLACCRCPIEMQMYGEVRAQIPSDKLDNVERFLTVFDACYQHYEKARDELQVLSREIKEKEELPIDFVLKLIYDKGEFKFHLMVRFGEQEEKDLNFVMEGSIFQAIAQLQAVKANALKICQQYRYQKHMVLLEQQIGSFIELLEKKYPGINSSPHIFKTLNSEIRINRCLKNWLDNDNAFSNVMLKQLGEVVKTRLQFVEAHLISFEKEEATYLDEKGMLDNILKSIQTLQLLPERRHQLATERTASVNVYR